MKVIDLLNKIANGEEVPEKILYNGKEWRLGINNNKDTDYIKVNDKNLGLFYEYLDNILIECLNDTVEIIEEQQDIDIQEIEEILDFEISDDGLYNYNFSNFKFTINELVQAVKQLDKRLKDKE